MRLVTTSQMRDMDSMTINEAGIPVWSSWKTLRGAQQRYFWSILIAGDLFNRCSLRKRNNGGDGYVMARYLHEKGMNVTVGITGENLPFQAMPCKP